VTFGTVTHKAGRPFRVSANAVSAAVTPAITTNYTGAPTAALSACAGAACTATFGTFSGTTFVSGQLASDVATYDNVGAFQLQLVDSSFASVDASDTTGDCTAAGRYVCSGAVTVGRFVPDHFTLTPSGASGPGLTNRNDVAACADAATTGTVAAGSTALTAGSSSGFATGDTVVVVGAGPGGIDLVTTVTVGGTSFTLGAAASIAVTNTPMRKINYSYMSEPIKVVFTLAAQNASNGTTSNYAGDFARLDPATPAQFSFGALNGTTDLTSRTSATLAGSWAAGTATFTGNVTLGRAGAGPDGPLNMVRMGIAPTDSDGVQLLAYNLDVNNDATNDRGSVGTTRLRFGRLVIRSASGSQLLPLRVPVEAQYWNGTFWITNVDDSCTPLTTTNIGLDNYIGNLGAGETTATVVPLSAGRGAITLSAPGSGNNGSVDVAVNLGAVATADACPSFAPTATAANKSYLRGNWCNGTYTKDPAARARFGIRRGSDEMIYMRESFN
jgi:MSHA biogenesis protein MshQ